MMDAGRADSVWQLCEKLRAEKLLVSSEVVSVQTLHKSLEENLLKLGLLSWNNRQHQIVLHKLLGSHQLFSPENSASIACQLNNAVVTEAHKRLGHHHSNFSRLLSILHSSPLSVAELLNNVDGNQSLSTEDVLQAIYSLVYGNGVFPSDEKLMLEILSHLIKVQLLKAPDPRHVIRKGNAAFPRLYKLFSESLVASKIFLTSALHDSVMLVLCQDDIFLDIDPSKSPLRFPTAERVRRFGEDPHSPMYHKKVAAHRKTIVEKLVLLAHNFIKGICDSLVFFPSGLIWLVKKLHSALVNKQGLSDDTALLICADLIVTYLICPAITNPETIGVISDTPISHIARFNLMQMGQIIQTLVFSRYEPPPPHFQLFATQFRDSPICTFVQSLLTRYTPELDGIFPIVLTESSQDQELFCRKHFMGSLNEVNVLTSLFHSGALDSISSSSVRDQMQGLSKKLPTSFASLPRSPADVSQGSAASQPRQSRLRNFKEKVQTSFSNNQSPSRINNVSPQRVSSPTIPIEHFDVVVFQLESDGDPMGLISEESFMEKVAKESSRRSNLGDGREKRARFMDTGSTVGSAISDRTTDNASDLEEEAAEQDEVGSVSSSQEAPQEDRMLMLDEDNASTLPDNVSDVGGMSARASPSLSGRDTPLSQMNRDPDAPELEIDLAAASTAAGAATVNVAQRNLPAVPNSVRKENAEGLEEKFGKFTVPTDQNRPYRDDQRSLLSESWSTNVVASDDEAPTPPTLPHLLQPEGEHHRGGRHVNRTGSLGGGGAFAEDRSDTWSLDAIASDSEADGGRERERQVREIQNDVMERDQEELQRVEAQVDISPGNEGERMRRQSSGSSFSYSRSDVGSEFGREHEEERPNLPPAIPAKQPVQRASSHDTRPSPSLPPRQNVDPSRPGPSNESQGARRTLSLFQGLKEKVGDKVRKGINNSTLRQLPHSSTFSDIFGDLSFSDRNEAKLTESRSENRLADMDRSAAEDILAKYQRPSPAVLIDISDDISPPPGPAPVVPNDEELTPYYIPENLSQCRAFKDAKRKLRLVLSSVGTLPIIAFTTDDKHNTTRSDSEREQLTMLLRNLLAEAINERQHALSAHIREVMRCIQIFDSKAIRKLLRTLRDEHRRRTSYVLYLQHSRLTLLRLNSLIEKLIGSIGREKTLASECLVDVLIRFYLEHKDHHVRGFLQEFSGLSVQDEKIESLTRTLTTLFSRMSQSSMWADASEEMISYAKLALERVVMGQIHAMAFYPNLEADRHRDELLHKALSKLGRTITPDHPMLKIPSALHGEAPWPSAQAEISIINAYKSARDKLACIVRCCDTISNLVSMAPGVGAAAADDVTPVLVYVLIQANPPALFSNVQYIQSFGGSLLEGAEGYWWIQFTAAIEFIKTLL